MQTMERSGPPPIHKTKGPAPWPVAFYRSAVGKKWVMAISGIMLMGFVAYHMVGNLHIYEGAAEMNHYGEFLRELLVPILPRTVFLWIARIGLIAAFFFHIHSAVGLTRINQKSRAGAYVQPRDYQAANVASRSMRVTGAIILIYLFFHLADLTWGWINPDFVRGDVYRNVQASLGNLPVAIIYIVANIALGLHLFHGSWSMFQSLGLNNPKYNDWRRRFAAGFALIVTIGNLSFPLAVQAGLADDDACIKDGNVIVTCQDPGEGE